MKKFLIALMLLNVAFAQTKPRLDTIAGVVTLTDKDGITYNVCRENGGKSYIVKDGKKIFIFRREKKQAI